MNTIRNIIKETDGKIYVEDDKLFKGKIKVTRVYNKNVNEKKYITDLICTMAKQIDKKQY